MENILNNNALAALTKRAGPQITQAIKAASQKTGVDFAYLMEKAAAESSFNADAKAKTSSASGLYQFIESTWINMVEKHGHKYGIDKTQDRQTLLEQRNNPQKAAMLAAEFAAENKAHLERHVGGDIGATELYFAHFMGASGATGFLNAMKETPMATAADLFPKAARANHNVFYDRKTGEARTLAGVYDFFDKKFGETPSNTQTSHAAKPSQSRGGISYEELLAQNPSLAGITKKRNENSDLWQRFAGTRNDFQMNTNSTKWPFSGFHKPSDITSQNMQLLLLAQLHAR